jgi:hypothetical protein
MKAGARHRLRGQPARQMKSGSAKLRMSRANPFLFQTRIPLPGCINHKWQAATMPFRGVENADLSATLGMLASLRGACETSGADLTFATCVQPFPYANVKSKAPLASTFASGPLILTFANLPAPTGCEC